jgi:hypothetical protein
MAIETPRSSTVSMRLNGGVKAGTTGTIQVYNVSLGKMAHGADKDKILTIVDSITTYLKFPILRIDRIETTTIEA